MKLLGFDIEISNIFDLRPGEDIDRYRAVRHLRCGHPHRWG